MNEKLIVVMVGLPARGKSYITKKIANYLNWLNISNEIFNVGNRRRQSFNPLENQAEFFSPTSEENVSIREQLALETLDELLNYLTCSSGQVGIFDATNSTFQRRNTVVNHIQAYMSKHDDCDYQILFLESICTDQSIIDQNIMLKLNGPDYKKFANKELALNDFKQRLSNYESIYQSVTSSEFESLDNSDNVQYLKIIDINNLKTHNIHGVLPIILNSFLKSFQISKKNIYLTLKHINYDYLFTSSSTISILSSSPPKDLVSKRNTFKLYKIPSTFSLDQVHDLILQLESMTHDTIIQTEDEFLLNGILKYFNLFNYSKKSILRVIESNVICINPDLYTVEYSRMKLNQENYNPAAITIPHSHAHTHAHSHAHTHPTYDTTNEPNDNEFIQTPYIDDNHDLSPPIMTRSSSSLNTTYDVMTPVDTLWDHKYNYKDLNLTELTAKLELLK